MRGARLIAVALMFGGMLLAAERVEISARDELVKGILQQTDTLQADVLDLAVQAYREAEEAGHVTRRLMTVVDYRLPSYEKRLWVLDMESGKVLFEEWVAHGMGRPRGSGGDMEMAADFSNAEGSRRSSLGLYITAETYTGRHGHTLRLDGLEPGVNDAARDRLIVLHGAHYVTADRAEDHLVGRSWGCPVVRKEIATDLIDAIKGGSVLWIYYPDEQWLEGSEFLDGE